MNDEQKRLKQFVEDHFPFDALKKEGFFEKGTRRTDYEKIAARMCWYFGFESVYEYALLLPRVHAQTETTVNGKFPDAVDEKGQLQHGGGFHLSAVQTAFACPACTCEQEADDHAAYRRKNALPIVKIKCVGCKRPLTLFTDPMTGRLSVSE